MKAPTWLKPAFTGGVVGAIATMIAGFSYGGWMLGSSAEKMAQAQSAAAVTKRSFRCASDNRMQILRSR